MKKFEVLDLAALPKGARFYFISDGQKRVYEVTDPFKPGVSMDVGMKAVGFDRVRRVRTYFRRHIGAIRTQPSVQCVFLSSYEERKNDRT